MLEAPYCAPCVDHVERRWPWAIPALFVVAVLLAVAATLHLVPDLHDDVFHLERLRQIVVGVTVLGLAAFGWYAVSVERARKVHAFTRRTPEEHDPALQGGGYREAAKPRRTRELAPPLSADEATICLLGALMAAGVIATTIASGAPLWLRAEAVLGAMFAVIAGGTTWVIYRGQRVSDDGLEVPRQLRKDKRVKEDLDTDPSGDGLVDTELGSIMLPHELLIMIAALTTTTGPGVLVVLLLLLPFALVFGLAAAAALAVPLAYVWIYRLLGKGLVRVSRLHGKKAGQLGPSLTVGVVAGLVLTAPFALLILVAAQIAG